MKFSPRNKGELALRNVWFGFSTSLLRKKSFETLGLLHNNNLLRCIRDGTEEYTTNVENTLFESPQKSLNSTKCRKYHFDISTREIRWQKYIFLMKFRAFVDVGSHRFGNVNVFVVKLLWRKISRGRQPSFPSLPLLSVLVLAVRVDTCLQIHS